MRISVLALAVCVFAGWALAQNPPPKTLPTSILPANHAEPSVAEQRTLMARRAVEWLYRSNQLSGRFVAGIQPVGGAIAESNGMVAQAQCAAALAVGARHFADERYAVRARQAVLALLTETALDPKDVNVRRPEGSRALAGAAMLVWAIHELPQPANDLVGQGEQLCQFIARQQQPNGMLGKETTDAELTDQGMALFALMKSQVHRPAPWKTEVLRKAMAGVQGAWAAKPSAALATWHARAYAEAFIQSSDRSRDLGYGQLAVVLCDHLLKSVNSRQADVAWPLLAMHDGLRVTQYLPDLERNNRYLPVCDFGVALVDALQCTSANCQHLPAAQRTSVIGAMRTSAKDATIRGEHTAAAVLALIGG